MRKPARNLFLTALLGIAVALFALFAMNGFDSFDPGSIFRGGSRGYTRH